LNGKPDALSWHPESRPDKGHTEYQPIITALSKKHFETNIIEEQEVIATPKLHSKSWIQWDIQSLDRVRLDGKQDEVYIEELKKLRKIYEEKKKG
jgi:hypothetical protein